MIQDDIRAALAEIPAGADPKFSTRTKALYAPLLQGVATGVEIVSDVAYGDHPRQRLDLHRIPGTKPSAVVVYIPGGGFTGGDKRSDATFFGNVGRYFAKAGMLGITMNYRLAPDHPWPAGAQDVDAVIAWIAANAVTYETTGAPVVVFGHSAGASHCATFLFDPDIRGHEKVTGGVLASGGAYAVRAEEMRPNLVSYYGEDATRYAHRSALSHVAGTKVPVMLACAERDPPYLAEPTLEMALALTRRDGACPPLRVLEGHNHFSPPCSLGTSDDEFGGSIRRFIARLKQI